MPSVLLPAASSLRRTHIIACENRGDWGYSKRALGTELASQEYLVYWCDDDFYAPEILERQWVTLLREDLDIVFVDWREANGTTHTVDTNTCCNFMVKSALAKQVGWPEPYRDTSDQEFIRACLAGRQATKVGLAESLYLHNGGIHCEDH